MDLENINKKTDLLVLYSNEFVVREDKSIAVDFFSCNEDSDCIKVRGDVCGCNGRGTADAINKKFEQEWKDKLKTEWQKDPITCLQIISEHPSCFKMPVCVENKCVLN